MEYFFESSQVRDCAGDTGARSDSDIVMRSPAAKDPDLTSGLRGFNPGRALVCVSLLVACFCLFLLVFWLLPEPGGKAEKQSRDAVLRVVFPLRFRCVSFPLRFQWRASPWPLPRGACEGSPRQRAVVKEPMSERDGKETPCQRAMVKDGCF